MVLSKLNKSSKWGILTCILSTITFISLSSFSYREIPHSKLDLKLTNLSGKGAYIHLGFYKKGSNFPNEGKHTFQKIITVPEGEFEINASWNLPAGEYAIAVFEDINGDDELKKSFLGMPQEPYGFSKNFVPKFSAPDFEDCAINLSTDQQIAIKMLN